MATSSRDSTHATGIPVGSRKTVERLLTIGSLIVGTALVLAAIALVARSASLEQPERVAPQTSNVATPGDRIVMVSESPMLPSEAWAADECPTGTRPDFAH